MNIGQKIKILRAKKGLNQQGLADRINKTRTLISHIERTSKANYYTLCEIAKVLEVPVTHFTEDNDLEIMEEGQTAYFNLAEKVKKLERENQLLNEIVDNQKEIIQQLKEKLG